MTGFRVKTRHAYEDLMEQLYQNGCEWAEGGDADSYDGYDGSETVLQIDDDGKIASTDMKTVLLARMMNGFDIYNYSPELDVERIIEGNMQNGLAVHTETREQFNELMAQLNEKGWRWKSNLTTTLGLDLWDHNKKETVVSLDANGTIMTGSIDQYKEHHRQGILSFHDDWEIPFAKHDKEIIYMVESEDEYRRLMKHLEDQGIVWRSGEKPTEAMTDYNEEKSIHVQFGAMVQGDKVEARIMAKRLPDENGFMRFEPTSPELATVKKIWVSNLEEYNELMQHLEERGFRWIDGDDPTFNDYFKDEPLIIMIYEEVKRIQMLQTSDLDELPFQMTGIENFNISLLN